MTASRSRVWTVLALVSALLTVGTVALALLAGVEQGGTLWWTFWLAVTGSLVFLGAAGRGRLAVLGIALLAAAAVTSGWVVWTEPGVGTSARFLGAGAPSELTAALWLMLVGLVTLMAVTALRRKEISGVNGRTWWALLAVAAAVAGVAGAGAWLGGRGLAALRTDLLRENGVDHTVDAAADPESSRRGGATTGPAQWRTAWQQPATNRTVVGTPIADLAVSATVAADDRSGIAVLDSRTGAERWHFHTRLFGFDDAVAVSPTSDRLLMIAGSAAILFDLDSGTEVTRFALPDLTAGPTLGSVRYRILSPLSHDRAFSGEPPSIDITGDVAYIAVTGHPGPSDLLAVSLYTGEVTTLATRLPESCRFRALRPNEYVAGYDFETWLLRDGAGCGTPTVTRLFRGRTQVETPIPQACAPQGCDLPDAYATERQLVLQSPTDLLTLDNLGAVQASTPFDPNRRSVITPGTTTPTTLPPDAIPRTNTAFTEDGATYFQYHPNSGQLTKTDTITGRETTTSEPARCTDPVSLSIAADTLILSCGNSVTAVR